jgi:hypothetical protein
MSGNDTVPTEFSLVMETLYKNQHWIPILHSPFHINSDFFKLHFFPTPDVP